MADTKEVTKFAVLSQVRFLSFEIQATYLCLVLNVYFQVSEFRFLESVIIFLFM